MAKIYAELIKKGLKTLEEVPEKILNTIFRKEVNIMAVIYATLIVKGKKVFADVPDKIKDKVREILIDLEVPELAE